MIGITGTTKLSKDPVERHKNRSVSRNVSDPDAITIKEESILLIKGDGRSSRNWHPVRNRPACR